MAKVQTISPREAAHRLGVTLDHVYKLIYGGQLPARKQGQLLRVDAQAVKQRRKRLSQSETQRES